MQTIEHLELFPEMGHEGRDEGTFERSAPGTPYIAVYEVREKPIAIEEHNKVLEIGTGLGYQTAVLAELAEQVFSIEIIEELAREGERRLRAMGCDNVQLRGGDGSRGWAEHAPFDKIIVTAAPKVIPQRLLEQLKVGGRMVLPAGPDDEQKLHVVEKDYDHKLTTRELIEVRFLPLITSH